MPAPRRSLHRLLVGIAVVGAATASPYVWCGGVTSNSAEFRVYAPTASTFSVSTSMSFATTVRSQAVPAAAPTPVSISSLQHDTVYFYRVESDPGDVGRFRTFKPENTTFDFTFGFASCADTDSNAEIFNSIASQDPLFFVHMGDLHYLDIVQNETHRYAEGYRGTQRQPNQRNLFRSTPVVYMFDDHDFGDNNADGSNTPGRVAAQQAYRDYVGHFPLPAGDRGAVYQSFVVGRVLFIVTDLRSDSALSSDPESTLGKPQKAWFRSLLEDHASYALVVWVDTKPWIGPVSDDEDEEKWFASKFAGERREIADMIAEIGVKNLVSVAGDAHMLAMDDGSHSDYSDKGAAGFPIFQAAAMDRTGSTKGGPFSHGCFAYRLWQVHQYGTLSVSFRPDGDVCLAFRGYRDDEAILTWSQCRKDGAFVVDGTGGESYCSAELFPGWVWALCVAVGVVLSAASGGAAVCAVNARLAGKGCRTTRPGSATSHACGGDEPRLRSSSQLPRRASRATQLIAGAHDAAEAKSAPLPPLPPLPRTTSPTAGQDDRLSSRSSSSSNGDSTAQLTATEKDVPRHVKDANSMIFSQSNPLLDSKKRFRSANVHTADRRSSSVGTAAATATAAASHSPQPHASNQ